MADVIRLRDRERPDISEVSVDQTGSEGLQSLFESCCSIIMSLEHLQAHLDYLKPVLNAQPDSIEKSHANLAMRDAETQVRECLMRFIGTSAAVARIQRP
jgi:hypothetical protein